MRRVNTKQSSVRFATWIILMVLGLCGLGVDSGRGQRDAEAEAEKKPETEAEAKTKSKENDGFAGKVVVIPIRIEDLNESKRFRALKELLAEAGAGEDAARAIVFELNVNGTADWETHQRILEELPKIEVQTFAFVNPSALVAGCIFAVGTDAIYMSPVGVIGGAGLEPGDEENEEAFRRSYAQSLSVIKARARSLAISKGYRPEVVEAFIDADEEVKIGEEIVSAKGEILTLTADEATKVYEGKPLLAKGIAEDVAALLKQENITAETLRLSPSEYLEQRNRERLGGSGKTTAGATSDEPGDGEEPGVFDRRIDEDYAGKILVLEVGEDALATGKARFQFMERVLRKANDDGAEAVIFDIDTPGGFSWYTQGLVLNVLQDMTVPTFSFVNTRAESAGAIVAIGTDTIYMRRAATIGSALTVDGLGGDIEGDMKSKIESMAIAMVRNMAALKGHNPDVAEAFVVRTKEVVIDGEVIHPAGEVLNLNTVRATEEYNGRPLLAKGVVNSVTELVEKEGLKGEIVELKPLGLERFAHLVQKFSAVLLLLGMAGAWAELKAPGFGVPGVVSLIAFGLFFFGNNLAGNLAGYELAVLLVLGFALLAVEIFIVPGTLVAGVTGGLMILAALVLAMVDRVDFGAAWDKAPGAPAIGDILVTPLLNVLLAMVGAAVAMFFLLRYLPQAPGMRWMILKEALPVGTSLDGNLASGSDEAGAAGASVSRVGSRGVAITDLRPAGKGRFGDTLMDITADGEFIDKGTALKVVRHEGSLVVVEAE